MGTLTCHPDSEAYFIHELHQSIPVESVDYNSMPLFVLAERLVLGPPSIGVLVDMFDRTEYVAQFLELVREYLPEHEAEIMTGARNTRAERFANLFGRQYFELDMDLLDYGDDIMAELTSYIPIRLMGLGYEEYHNIEYMHDSAILMLSLIDSPWLDFDDDDEGGRAALVDKVRDIVGDTLAERIPEKGLEPKELHRRLDGTKYQALASFADWIWHDTGMILLDNDYEQSGCGWGVEMIPWDPETVEALAEQTPKIREFWDSVNHLDDWLRDSLQEHFDEMLAFLLKMEPVKVPKEQMPLPLEKKKPKTLMEVFAEEGKIREATIDDIEEITRF